MAVDPILVLAMAIAGTTLPPPLPCRDPATGAVTVRVEDIRTVGGDVEPPVVTTRVSPDLPPELRVAGLMVVDTTIDTSGKVCAIRALKSPSPELGALVTESIRRWTFEPAKQGGKPVAVRYLLTASFHPR